MASITCPGCGTKLESNERPCPTCGYKKDPTLGKKLLQFAALFAILGALWLYFLVSHTAEKKPAPAVPGEAHPAVESP